MRNISQSPRFAAAAVKEVFDALEKKAGSDYGDWLFAMMRKGFTKAEAFTEFQNQGLKLLPDSTIEFPKVALEKLKEAQRIRRDEIKRQTEDLERRSNEMAKQVEELKAKVDARIQNRDNELRRKFNENAVEQTEKARKKWKKELERRAKEQTEQQTNIWKVGSHIYTRQTDANKKTRELLKMIEDLEDLRRP